jgi:cation transport ATPase
VQRVADAVAGKFCYGVMAASAATFAFWQTLGGLAGLSASYVCHVQVTRLGHVMW